MSARVLGIDGLRGFAAVIVVIGHWIAFMHVQGVRLGHETIDIALSDEYLSLGRVGVVAFFCVSGFVIPFSFSGSSPEISFIIKRIFRLYPAYWLSIFLVLALSVFNNEFLFSTITIIANLSMIHIAFGQPGMLVVYWTLLIEIIFYFICFCLFCGRTLNSFKTHMFLMCSFLAIGAAMAAYRFSHPASELPVGLPTYLAAMHFGTLFRMHKYSHQQLGDKKINTVAFGLLVIVFGSNTAAYFFAENEDTGWIAASTSYAVGLVLFMQSTNIKLFQSNIFQFFGKISYSLYLFHAFLLLVATALLPHFQFPFGFLLLTIFFSLACLMISYFVERYVEQPSVEFGRRLSKLMEWRVQCWKSSKTPTRTL